ncbi:MAG: DUF1553 domain-containing protein [Planctomycetaceae bacterium]|nr:MAG: DUF1553 domain-containing protein [Planctomycetaceae bacterium]
MSFSSGCRKSVPDHLIVKLRASVSVLRPRALPPFTRVSSALVAIVLVIAGWATAAKSGHAAESGDAGEPAELGETRVAAVGFNRDVRPILSDRCFYCHGPDEKNREAGLRLDIREAALEDRGGGAAIVAGDPDASLLIERVTDPDESMVMPPPESKHGRLSDEEVQTFRRWIAEGAEYEAHWALVPLGEFDPPVVRQSDRVANPIDQFVLAKLESLGIEPSQEADRATLIRRLSLDLLGILPDPQRVAAFEADGRPDAYERLVDELLASPYFGERWARHWLDQARYADSNGYSIDGQRAMWPYRDWVIRAIQDDMPFDRFTVEQLAGDLLPGATKDQQVASAFHRNTLINQEGGSDPEQFRHEAVVDRVNTTGAVWLGLTLGCAQCHTHKFDPISDREYYQLFAFFNSGTDINSVGATVPVSPGEMLGIGPAPIDDQRAARRTELEGRLRERLAEQQRVAEAATAASESVEVTWTQVAWATDDPSEPLRVDGDAVLERQPDGSLLVVGTPSGNATYRLRLPISGKVAAIRLRVLADDRLPKRGPGTASNGNFVLTAVQLVVDGEVIRPLAALADHAQPGYPVAAAIDGDPKTGWAINIESGSKAVMNADHEATFVLSTPIELAGDADATDDSDAAARDSEPAGAREVWIELKHELNQNYLVGRFAIDTAEQAPPVAAETLLPDAELVRALGVPAGRRAAADKKRVDDALKAAFPEVRDWPATPADARVMVMAERDQPRPTFVSIRGDFLRPDESIGAVSPGGLAAVAPTLEPEAGRNRLDLAEWLVDRDNPLTPRVTVNRVWMRYFGRGLVETEEDFGTQGTPPTHPELLDWLARQLQGRGWSMKSLHRLIVTSSTYRQASRHRADLLEIDANNRLLARQNRLRVEAEIVRDAALSASGRWAAMIGGPGVQPPQPDGVYAFTQNVKSWKADTGTNRYRRGMYTEFFRSAPHPLFTTFDTPDFQTVCTRRNRSNTPLQALTIANDEAFIELARGLAARLFRELPDATVTERLVHAFRLAVSRQPSEVELEILVDHHRRLIENFATPEGENEASAWLAGDPQVLSLDQPAEVAAFISISRTIINTDNFITRE